MVFNLAKYLHISITISLSVEEDVGTEGEEGGILSIGGVAFTMSVGTKKGIGMVMGGVSVVKMVSSSVMSSVGGESEKGVFSFGKEDIPNADRAKLDF